MPARSLVLRFSLSVVLLLASGCGGGGGGSAPAVNSNTGSSGGSATNLYLAAPAAGGYTPQLVLAASSSVFTLNTTTAAPPTAPEPTAARRVAGGLGGVKSAAVFAYMTMTVSAQTPFSEITGEIVEVPAAVPNAAYGLEIDDITAGATAKIATVPGTFIQGFNTASFNNTYALLPLSSQPVFVPGHTYLFQYYDVPAAVTAFTVPTSSSTPSGIAVGADGALWFGELMGNKIGRVTTAGTFSEFPIPTSVNTSLYGGSSGPAAITAGPDGALWFTEVSGNKIGRITTTGVITEIPVPTTLTNGPFYGTSSGPMGIASGPDGALWFTEWAGNKIGRVTTAGVLTEYPIPTANSEPTAIVGGSDGALWFTEYGTSAGKIGRISVSGSITEYPLTFANDEPYGIVSGPDGALWFSEVARGKIGRMTTAGALTEAQLPETFPSIPGGNPSTIGGTFGAPSGITFGSDGALWFGDTSLNRMTTAGELLGFNIQTASSDSCGSAIVSGPDGALYCPVFSNAILKIQ